MKRDSLTFGTAEEAAIDQYLRDKAEDEIYNADVRFRDWVLEKEPSDLFQIIVNAVNYDPEINHYAEKLRDEYIESRIEDRDERIEAYRGLFEETSDVE